ncbi:hypothetical protein CRG98_001359, partial [Punica granatum]
NGFGYHLKTIDLIPCPDALSGLDKGRSGISHRIPRSGGLVDYDDDEDDEDYRPPPRKQPDAMDEDDGAMESLRLKRKPLKEKTPELGKKQRLNKSTKSKDSVFAALCSTLSQAVLPGKRGSNSNTTPGSSQAGESNKGSDEKNGQETEALISRGSPDSSSSKEETVDLVGWKFGLQNTKERSSQEDQERTKGWVGEGSGVTSCSVTRRYTLLIDVRIGIDLNPEFVLKLRLPTWDRFPIIHMWCDFFPLGGGCSWKVRTRGEAVLENATDIGSNMTPQAFTGDTCPAHSDRLFPRLSDLI